MTTPEDLFCPDCGKHLDFCECHDDEVADFFNDLVQKIKDNPDEPPC